MCATERSRAALAAATVLGVWTTACVTNPAPKGFLPAPVEAQQVAVGGWIELQLFGPEDAPPAPVAGELLAVTRDSLWIATEAGGVAVSAALIREGRLFGYDGHHSRVAAAALLGVVGTVSNGFFLVFTAPMWILGGTAAAAGQSKIAMTELPGATADTLRPWARFPAGLPPDFDLVAARPATRAPAADAGGG